MSGGGRPPPCLPFLGNGIRGSPSHSRGSGTDLPQSLKRDTRKDLPALFPFENIRVAKKEATAGEIRIDLAKRSGMIYGIMDTIAPFLWFVS